MTEHWKGEDRIRAAKPTPAILPAANSAPASEQVLAAKILMGQQSGKTKAECARDFNINYQRVCTLARKYGVTFTNGNTMRRWDRSA